MPTKRLQIPRAISDRVLKEYRHKCAICGRDRPHLHHLDQDPANNDPLNLLPLCPNCHLQDVHDPTQRPDPEKLRLFRRYKDPLILDPRFHPIFRRMMSLRRGILGVLSQPNFKYYATEFLDFIGEFEMGSFYRKKINLHLSNPARFYAHHILLENGVGLPDNEVLTNPTLKRKAEELCVTEIEELVVELLRYQEWTAEAFKTNLRE